MLAEISVVKAYWQYINTQQFSELAELFTPDAAIAFPNTQEIFVSVAKFIEFNNDYPGSWSAEIQDIFQSGNQIITITKVWEKSEPISFFVTSLFQCNNNRISSMVEYWSENSSPPEWRKTRGYTRTTC